MQSPRGPAESPVPPPGAAGPPLSLLLPCPCDAKTRRSRPKRLVFVCSVVGIPRGKRPHEGPLTMLNRTISMVVWWFAMFLTGRATTSYYSRSRKAAHGMGLRHAKCGHRWGPTRAELGVDRHAKARALRCLRDASLVAIQHETQPLPSRRSAWMPTGERVSFVPKCLLALLALLGDCTPPAAGRQRPQKTLALSIAVASQLGSRGARADAG